MNASKEILFTLKGHVLIILFFICNFIFAGSVSYAADAYIVVNQGSFATVEEAAFGEKQVNYFDSDLSDERAATECYAAIELRNFLGKVSKYDSSDIHFTPPTKLPAEGDVFILGSSGSNKLIVPKGAEEFESDQAYRIRSVFENDRIITTIEGAERVGTLYGVYRYLEQLGINFIGLGEMGTVMPSAKIEIPRNLKIAESPSFLTRGYWAWGDRDCDPEFFEWMARNRMNFWTAQNQPVKTLKKLGIKLTDGGHLIQRLFINPESQYRYQHQRFDNDPQLTEDPYPVSAEYLGDENQDGLLSNYEAHPEWYGLQKGERARIIKDKGGVNFCTSNAHARKELARNMVSALIEGEWKFVDVVNFWMLDYGTWCECDECKADGTETDRLFLVVNDVLKELKSAREKGLLNRTVEISAIAYAETLTPPQKPLPEDYDYENSSVSFFPIRRCFAHPFADDKCSELNHSQLEAYESWIESNGGRFKGSMFIGEYYNISKFKSLPLVFTNVITTDVPWYFENGARHFHYMHVPTKLWGTWSLNQYLLGRILWDVKLDTPQFLEDYYQSFYPTTADTTRQMYEQLEIVSANMKILKHDVGTPWHFNLAENFLKGDMFQLEHFKYEPTASSINRAPSMVEVMQAATKAHDLMKKSLAECADETERKRLLEDNRRVEYGYHMAMYLYHIVRTAMFHQEGNTKLARAEFIKLEAHANKLRQVTELVNVSAEDANSKNGFEAAHSVKQFNTFKKLYGKKH
ncbi:DUF4838 domain-containing protein [Luteolibacter algae]|uniref:DUF4838 domain-containing protein n=1 Tax=Luteolibacter algae TaxID=454151 RepID=A0ABW5D4G0_9BACT